MNKKSRSIAIVLALVFGSFGLHKFYLGKNGQGLLSFIFFWTLIPGILAIFEAISYAFKSDIAWDELCGNRVEFKRPTRLCGDCAEEILADAKKCKHCGSMIAA